MLRHGLLHSVGTGDSHDGFLAFGRWCLRGEAPLATFLVILLEALRDDPSRWFAETML